MTISNRIIWIFLILCLSCSDGSFLTSTTESNQKANPGIAKLIEDYYETMSERDWEEYRSFFWEKGIITTVWQNPGKDSSYVYIVTIDEFIDKTPEGPDSQPIFEEKLLDSKMEVKGNLALVWAKYKAKFGTKGNLMEWGGTDLFTLMQHNNQWKIVSLAFEPE